MRLILKKDGDSVKEFQIAKQNIQIGRQPDCDVILANGAVSRKHAVLSYDELSEVWTLKDKGSANKTYLNDKAVRKSEVKTGDLIRIGNCTIEVDLKDKQEEKPVRGDDTLNMEASLTTPRSETVVRKPDASHAPAMRLAAKRLTDFSQATEILCATESLDKMLQSLMDVLIKQFNAFHVWCALREQPSGRMTYYAGKRRDGKDVVLADLQLQDKITQAIERGQSSVMPRVSAQMEKKDRIRSAMIAPIMRKSGCFGVLYVDNAMVHNHYSLSDLDYLMFVAIHTAAILKKFLDV